MMQLGYHWARHAVRGWRIVEVVRGLHEAVLEGSYAVKVSEYSEFVGPLDMASHENDFTARLDFMRKVAEDWEEAHDDLVAKLEVAYAKLYELRIRLGELPECQ
jgi:hypothetical protein